jgi:hypothetical protein
MNRTTSLCLFAALIGLVAACGKVVVDPIDHDGASGGSESGSSSGSGGAAAATTTGGTGGEAADGGGMCNAPLPPTPTVPDQPGCYFNMGSGWVAVPCDCDLWMANTTSAPIAAGIQLTVTPPDQVPTLTGALDVEVAFDDPDASWYATWTKQVGSGQAFTVTSAGGVTTVRMGESVVALAPVSIAACTTRKATAQVYGGSYSAVLSMQAVLDNAIASATTEGTCLAPPPF